MGEALRGLGMHLYADHRRGCVFVVGRLADGRSFAAEDRSWRPTVYLGEADAARPKVVGLGCAFAACGFEALDGGKLRSWTAPGFGAYRDAVERLNAFGCAVHGGGSLPDLYRADRRLGLGLRVTGDERPGRRVDVVLADAVVEADDEANAPVSVLSLDIETDESDRSVRAASLSMADWSPLSSSLVRRPAPTSVLIVATGTAPKTGPDIEAEAVADERSLIAALRDRVVAIDPDVVTGWNIVEFDLARLIERAEALGLPFDIGRSYDGTRLLPKGRGRTATAIVPGRQVIDAMRVARSGPERYDDYTLETVARATLGRGKAVSVRGAAKIAELDRLYRDDIAAFIEYSAGDAALVLDLLQATGLFALTLARARLVGIGLDRAWTSVAAFERAYGEALRSLGIVPPPFMDARDVSGAAGGTVLPAQAGYREGVVVLDFKSLYPSVIRTFDIDPMSNSRSGAADDIVAPNGARFARQGAPGRWPLPALVDEYFGRREDAMARGDVTASYVYKILMNSFYGVLGTSSCRYARTELAGAVTSFGRLVLLGAKARIEREGFEVLYGDTDSLFIATGLGPDATYAVYRETADRLCALVNDDLAVMARRDYGLDSRLELRFDKAYARFVIPPLRLDEARSGRAEDETAPVARGRSKGYAGLMRSPDGDRVDVKGMEAVRSDWTPLARDFQMRLLSMVFAGDDAGAMGCCIDSILASLRRGELDSSLVYERSLRRSESAYVKSTPPHVKAARLAGLVGRGSVWYVIAADGPAPVDPDTYGRTGPGLPRPDYGHYVGKQLLPIARSLAAAGLPVPLDAFGSGSMQPELF